MKMHKSVVINIGLELVSYKIYWIIYLGATNTFSQMYSWMDFITVFVILMSIHAINLIYEWCIEYLLPLN